MPVFRIPDPEPIYDHKNESAFRRQVEQALSRNPTAANFARYTFTNLPAAGSRMDGRIVIDTTNSRLVAYAGGVRFYMPGTLF